MGKTTGFLEWDRAGATKREPLARLHDYRELYLERDEEAVRRQGGRCMDCGVPFCMQGCPLGNPIPDFNDRVYKGRWRAAFELLSSTNNFPEFTGRLCPAPCEAACVLAINTGPVTIEEVEKEIVERAFTEGWVQPEPPASRTGKRVAVVGSGPAGLAAAQQLNRAGHLVTVYERAEKLGGLLRYGIPDFKLEKHVIDRRLNQLEAEGVRFQVGADIGGALGYDQLKAEHDAVVLAIGARRARELEVPGRELSGVVQAMDFLEAQNRAVDACGASPLDASGKRVIILGGGDTGSDCLGTALRQGAASVTQIELMPAPPELRAAGNPWPQWPVVFRTSTSQEEGGERAFALSTKRLEGEGGRLCRLHAVEVQLAEESGRTHIVECEGSARAFDVDTLVLAMGFIGPETAPLEAQLGIELDARGNVQARHGYETSVPGVYVAGDAKRGASLIVWAIAEGRECARQVDAALMGRPSRLEVRGMDAPFGGR